MQQPLFFLGYYGRILFHVLDFQLITERGPIFRKTSARQSHVGHEGPGRLDTRDDTRECTGWAQGLRVCHAWRRAHHELWTLILTSRCKRGWTLHDLLCNLWILITATIYQGIYHTISFAAVGKQYWCFQGSFIIDSKKPKTKLKSKNQPYAYLT